MLDLRDYQHKGIQGLRQGFASGVKSQILYAPTGAGKCLGKGTPVVMYDGTIKRVEDVFPGDLLASPTGGFRTVLSTTSGYDDLFLVTQKKGDSYVVNKAHILSMKMTNGSDAIILSNGHRVEKHEDVVNVNVEVLFNSNKTAKHCLKGWRPESVSFLNGSNDDKILIHPYLLGMWLGDGRASDFEITKPHCNMIEWLYSHVAAHDHSVSMYKYGEKCQSYRIKNEQGENLFLKSLVDMGLKNNKHIPNEYKTASISNRLLLIAGLLDSDGSLSRGGYDWISKYENMAHDIAFICRSVGLSVYVSECTKGIKSTGFSGTYWRVSISGDCEKIPCLDKKAPIRTQKKRHLVHGVDIQPHGFGEYFGFELDGDKLFLLGDFTVTHNTELAISMMKAAAEKGNKCAMILDRIVLVNQTSERLAKYGIDHGVLQSGHWRYRPNELIQICSAQTLEKRGFFPGVKLLIVDECFAPDVEIMTERGFFRFDQLPRDVRVAQFEAEGAAISFVHPTEYIDKEYRGEMIRFWQERGADLLMTPGHELLIRSKSGKFSKRPVETAKLGGNEIPVAGKGSGFDTVLSPMERLLIALQADGSIHSTNVLSFTFMKDRKTKRLLQIVSDCGLSCHETPVDKRGRRRFLVSPVRGVSKLLSDHFNIANLSYEKAVAIIDEMVHWDGHIHSESSWYYSSTVKANADFYQAVAILAGYRTNLTVQIDDRSETFNDVHRLFIQKNRDYLTMQGVERTTVNYDGRVYCVRVPAGNIIVRKNGKPMVVGNCHQTRKETAKLIKNNPGIKVVGLTATPFTKGLGTIYEGVVGTTTTEELVETGNLAPLRVFAAKQIDMTGAKKVAGEWSDAEATERGIKITGDVVSEWVSKTHSIFGRPRKTIVFCASVAHGQDLAQKFAAAGYNFIPISYLDDDEFKKNVFEDFAREDTEIHGLIAVDILTKGFDCPDVMIGISARPFSKSFSSHVQQMGRVMRKHEGKDYAAWLDFSGNYMRFKDEWDELYSDGVSALDDGKEKAKSEPTDKEKEQAKCPKCGFIWRNEDMCPVCGHVRSRKNLVETVPGEMEEVAGAAKSKATKLEKQNFYSELLYYAETKGYKEGWVAHKYKEKFGVWPRGLDDTKRPTSLDVKNWLISRQIAYSKSRK